jgi:hypothetical protein
MWDQVDRMSGWVNQLMSLREQGAIKPKIARAFPFDQGRRGTSFHSGPQEHWEGVAHPIAGLPRIAASSLGGRWRWTSKDAKGLERLERAHAATPNVKLVGRAMPVLGADILDGSSGLPGRLVGKPFGHMLEALDDLRPNQVYVATGGSFRYVSGPMACGRNWRCGAS